MTPDLEAMYWEVHDLVELYAPQLQQSTSDYLREVLPEMEGLAISGLLWRDASGEVVMPDATVARLWEIGYAYGYDQDLLLSMREPQRFRPERRTRPPRPVLRRLAGGGHGPACGIPGTREFAARWDDDTTITHTMDVAQHPSLGRALPDGTYRVQGERDGVVVVVLSSTGEVLASYPVTGEDVLEHPLDEVRRPHVEALRALLDETVPPSPDEPRASLDELMAAGGWPHVITCLAALGVPDEQLVDLRSAARLAST